MVDCVGKVLNIGDKVICSDRHYADLLIGEIISFTPQKARIKYHRTINPSMSNAQLKDSYQIFKYSDEEGAE